MKKLMLLMVVALLAGCGDPSYTVPTKTMIDYVPNFGNLSTSFQPYSSNAH